MRYKLVRQAYIMILKKIVARCGPSIALAPRQLPVLGMG